MIHTGSGIHTGSVKKIESLIHGLRVGDTDRVAEPDRVIDLHRVCDPHRVGEPDRVVDPHDECED